MKAMRPVVAVLSLALSLSLLFHTPAARAQGFAVFDHLKCYNIKDLRTPGQWTADLFPEQMPPFAAELDCTIKSPAKLFCIDVRKNPVGAPTPPLQVVGAKAQDYLCYKVKCANGALLTLGVADQFGSGNITIAKRPRYVCAPAYKTGFPTPTFSPTPANPCPSPTQTPNTMPTACPLQCIAGPNNGGPCSTMAQSGCPAGTCAVPSCCCFGNGTPNCISTMQCPGADVCICP